MNMGKCAFCNKTTYDLEGTTVGPPGKKIVLHNKCFKCQMPGCGWKLNLTSYKFCDGKIWCANHNPMTGFSNQGHEQSGTVTTDDALVSHARSTPKLDNDRGIARGASGAGTVTNEDQSIAHARTTPRLDNDRGIARGASGAGTVTNEDQSIAHARTTPRLDNDRGIARGASGAGTVTSQDQSIAHATGAPKLDVVQGYGNKFCSNCGAAASGNFCSSCGNKIN
eukprot:TRINITY_DN284_c0_g2_i1.p1 TRINITY_DN284_c0_g2~~TRINITY_DN284_c0_g2_i1.p1  ORF type:complete len:224 (-),score=58.02 TRINITY_DN284_c0_g2_i1:23-694(-)